MTPTPASLAILAVVVMGCAVVWANPSRVINRVFFTLALHVAAWLFCIHSAVMSGEDPYWIRMASIIGGFIPAHLWILKEASVSGASGYSQRALRKVAIWMAAGMVLAVLCFSNVFITGRDAVTGRPIFGAGYFGYMIGVLTLYGTLCRETIVQIRGQSGLSRLELQIMLLGGSATAGAVIMLMALRAILSAVWPIEIQPLVVMAFYAGTVIAITTHRVFDARQILRVGMQKLIVVVVATVLAYLVDWLAKSIVPRPVDLFVTMALVLWISVLFNGWIDRLFHFYPQAINARHATFSAAQRESRLENLETAFLSIIKGWGQSEHALILSGTKDDLRGGGVHLDGSSRILATIRSLRWATPERLAREKTTVERQEVARFLREHALGALVIGEGPTLTTLVGVGTPASRRPFTYPQVTQLIELASIIESALERAHLSAKAQNAEQLATVGLLGASLAHEIRNPLVSIKTFVQLLPSHHQDPVFREKFYRLISDEVTRIDQLTEQLLDLASPRAYAAEMIELHPVLTASMELAAAKAAHKRIQFLTEFQANPDRAFTDASAAKQVMLNLCFNAIQAVESKNGEAAERWVKIATRNIDSGIEMVVADSGPGIDPEIRPKLFQPFQTTKSTGFGLGLAICSDILANLHATISVDPPAPGRGATFRVVFPCQPLSS